MKYLILILGLCFYIQIQAQQKSESQDCRGHQPGTHGKTGGHCKDCPVPGFRQRFLYYGTDHLR